MFQNPTYFNRAMCGFDAGGMGFPIFAAVVAGAAAAAESTGGVEDAC